MLQFYADYQVEWRKFNMTVGFYIKVETWYVDMLSPITLLYKSVVYLCFKDIMKILHV